MVGQFEKLRLVGKEAVDGEIEAGAQGLKIWCQCSFRVMRFGDAGNGWFVVLWSSTAVCSACQAEANIPTRRCTEVGKLWLSF